MFIGYAIGVLLTFGTVLTWVERKQAAIMSDRIGANRAYVRIPFTQIKLVWLGPVPRHRRRTEDAAEGGLQARHLRPLRLRDRAVGRVHAGAAGVRGDSLRRHAGARRRCSGVPALADWFGDRTYPLQIAQLDAGLLVVFAFGGITIIGAMLAGWSSNNKFSLLGALRAGSQMISYELVMGLTVLGPDPHLRHASTSTRSCSSSRACCSGFLPAWGIVYQPFAAILFLTAAIAENKRIPFDLPEAESELIAGYFTEYSAMKMGLFMFAEFIEIAIIGALFTTLFLGGYNLPYMTDAGFVFPGGSTIATAARRGRRHPARRVPRQGVRDRAASRSWCAGRCRASATTSCCASPGSSCSRWRSPTST